MFLFLVPFQAGAQVILNKIERLSLVGPITDDGQPAEYSYHVRFVHKPRLRRILNAAAMGLPESLRVEGVVKAVGDRGLPGRELGVGAPNPADDFSQKTVSARKNT
jgi:hypothetical protein